LRVLKPGGRLSAVDLHLTLPLDLSPAGPRHHPPAAEELHDDLVAMMKDVASAEVLRAPAGSPTHSFEQYRQCRQRQGKVVNTDGLS
jgi:hypothetical protein